MTPRECKTMKYDFRDWVHNYYHTTYVTAQDFASRSPYFLVINRGLLGIKKSKIMTHSLFITQCEVKIFQ